MEGDFININKSLLPFSWVYGLGVGFRNLLFEMGVLKSHSFSVPVISVGKAAQARRLTWNISSAC